MKRRQSLKEEGKQNRGKNKFTEELRKVRDLLNKLPKTDSNYKRLRRIERVLKNGYKERKGTN